MKVIFYKVQIFNENASEFYIFKLLNLMKYYVLFIGRVVAILS